MSANRVNEHDLVNMVMGQMLEIEEQNAALPRKQRLTGVQKREQLVSYVEAKMPDDPWAPIVTGNMADQFVRLDKNQVHLHPAICHCLTALTMCFCGYNRTGSQEYQIGGPPQQEMVASDPETTELTETQT